MKISETDTRTAAERGGQSIEEVFDAEESALLKFAYGYVKRREVAEEVVQDAFLKLHEQWDEVERARPWLYKAVRNISLNYIRKAKRETLTDDAGSEVLDGGADEQVGRLEAVLMMRLLMDDLGERDRELVRLKFEEDRSYSDIGERLEMGVGNVGYRLHFVLKGLAEGLRRKGIDGW
ncbi:MAG: RNA polymerase sigma factor [Akkermansiaceae bacterium]